MNTNQDTSKTKARPIWIAGIVAVLMTGLFLNYVVTGKIRVSSSRENAAYYIEYSDRPTDFILITSTVGILAIGSASYYLVANRKKRNSRNE